MMSKSRKSLLGTLSVLLAISHIGCGGRPGPAIPAAVISLSVDPVSAIVQAGRTASFTATVTDPQNVGVNWTVTCPATSCGSVSPTSGSQLSIYDGVDTTYMAPPSPPESNLTVTVTATSVTEPAAQGSVTITVPSVAVTVTPNAATVPSGGETQFTATVIGDPTDSGVTWNLEFCRREAELPFRKVCEQPPQCKWCGTISNTESGSGVPITYTAPASSGAGILTLTATSVANPLASVVVPITVSSSANSSGVDASDLALRDFQVVGILNPVVIQHSIRSR